MKHIFKIKKYKAIPILEKNNFVKRKRKGKRYLLYFNFPKHPLLKFCQGLISKDIDKELILPTVIAQDIFNKVFKDFENQLLYGSSITEESKGLSSTILNKNISNKEESKK